MANEQQIPGRRRRRTVEEKRQIVEKRWLRERLYQWWHGAMT